MGIFPTLASVIRLVRAVLIHICDEWIVADRRYPSEGSKAKLSDPSDTGSVAPIESSDA